MTRIIVTNDDGVQAPGILALAQAMRTLGEVTVVSPALNQSATGHKKTLFQDVAVSDVKLADGSDAISVGGTPADCIALSALGLTTEWPPDVVVSGINRGANMGQDVTYSGTVSAALEATINGARALAISLDAHDANDVEEYREAARVAVEVVKRVLEKGLPPLTILNLNVPDVPMVTGLRLTRQGIRIYRDELVRNGNICRIEGLAPIGDHEEEGTDVWAVHHGYASLTPIHLDLTAHRFLADLVAWDVHV
jgi:5'-nucleotidase